MDKYECDSEQNWSGEDAMNSDISVNMPKRKYTAKNFWQRQQAGRPQPIEA